MTTLPGSGPVGSHTHTVSGKTTSRNGGQTVTVQTDVTSLEARLAALEGWQTAMADDIIDLDLRLDLLENPTPPPVTPLPVVGKAITIRPGEWYSPAAGEVIDGWTITGPGDTTYDGKTCGIKVTAPNVTIRNCTISGFGDAGIRADGVSGLVIDGNRITDCAYAGVILTGCSGFRVSGNTVSRVGTRGHQSDANAYGITASMWGGGVPSRTGVIEGNTVTDVPLWHGIDTHGGQDIAIRDNVIRRSARAIFITANLAAERATRVTVERNLCADPVSNIPAGGTDANSAITLYDTRDCIVRDNAVGTYSVIVNDVGSLSQGLVQSGNVRGEAVP